MIGGRGPRDPGPTRYNIQYQPKCRGSLTFSPSLQKSKPRERSAYAHAQLNLVTKHNAWSTPNQAKVSYFFTLFNSQKSLNSLNNNSSRPQYTFPDLKINFGVNNHQNPSPRHPWPRNARAPGHRAQISRPPQPPRARVRAQRRLVPARQLQDF